MSSDSIVNILIESLEIIGDELRDSNDGCASCDAYMGLHKPENHDDYCDWRIAMESAQKIKERGHVV